MLEVHDLPTAEVYTATYYTYTSGVRDSGETLQKVVMYDLKTMLESGVPGVKRYVQISSTILADIPRHNDEITIDSVNYKILNPTRCANPAFVTFWESELKRV